MMNVSTVVTVIFCSFLLYLASGQTSLSSQDQQELLNAHNHFRGIVNPTASNMEIMNTFSYVGENLYITSSQSVNYTDSVRSWFDERNDYTYENNACNQGKVCGHYTQVVWASSNSLGCGAFRCVVTTGFDHNNSLIVVCNYGPGGNVNRQLPYTSGTPCSQCREGLNYCVSNLCSSSNDTDSNIVNQNMNSTSGNTDEFEFEDDTSDATLNFNGVSVVMYLIALFISAISFQAILY